MLVSVGLRMGLKWELEAETLPDSCRIRVGGWARLRGESYQERKLKVLEVIDFKGLKYVQNTIIRTGKVPLLFLVCQKVSFCSESRKGPSLYPIS